MRKADVLLTVAMAWPINCNISAIYLTSKHQNKFNLHYRIRRREKVLSNAIRFKTILIYGLFMVFKLSFMDKYF